jgi:hypothetical protein
MDYRGPVIIAVPRLATVITVFVIEDGGEKVRGAKVIGYRFPAMTRLNVAILPFDTKHPFHRLGSF